MVTICQKQESSKSEGRTRFLSKLKKKQSTEDGLPKEDTYNMTLQEAAHEDNCSRTQRHEGVWELQ